MAVDEAGKDTVATASDGAEKDTMVIDEAEKDTNDEHANTTEEDAVDSHSQHGMLMGQPRSYATILTTEIKIA